MSAPVLIKVFSLSDLLGRISRKPIKMLSIAAREPVVITDIEKSKRSPMETLLLKSGVANRKKVNKINTMQIRKCEASKF